MEWAGVTAHDETRTVLKVGDVGVARLSERLGGTWFIWLWYHRPEGQRITRNCSSLEQGRAGAEIWAARHMDTLLADAAVIRSKWAVLPRPTPYRPAEFTPMYPDGDPPHPGKKRGKRSARRGF